MKKIKLFGTILVTALCLALSVNAVEACKGHGSSSRKKGLEGKFNYKVQFVLGRWGELQLSEKQMTQIKDLNNTTTKYLITKNAEIDVLAVDVKSQMHQATMNLEAINKLVDQKYALKNERAKATIKAISDLKNVLNDEQKTKFKTLLMNAFSACSSCPLSKGSSSGKICPLKGKGSGTQKGSGTTK